MLCLCLRCFKFDSKWDFVLSPLVPILVLGDLGISRLLGLGDSEGLTCSDHLAEGVLCLARPTTLPKSAAERCVCDGLPPSEWQLQMSWRVHVHEGVCLGG